MRRHLIIQVQSGRGADKQRNSSQARAVIRRDGPGVRAIASALSSSRPLEVDFNEHGAQAISQVREKKPEVYMRVVADLLPKEASINVEASEAFTEMWRRISDGLGDALADCLEEPSLVLH